MIKIVQISTGVFPVIQETPLGNSMSVLARTVAVDEFGRGWILKPTQFGKDTWESLPEIPEIPEESNVVNIKGVN